MKRVGTVFSVPAFLYYSVPGGVRCAGGTPCEAGAPTEPAGETEPTAFRLGEG